MLLSNTSMEAVYEASKYRAFNFLTSTMKAINNNFNAIKDMVKIQYGLQEIFKYVNTFMN